MVPCAIWCASWLVDDLGCETMHAGVDGTGVFHLAEPIVLLRVRAMKKLPGGGWTSEPEATDGVMVWIKHR